jgi:hypothetical protein
MFLRITNGNPTTFGGLSKEFFDAEDGGDMFLRNVG